MIQGFAVAILDFTSPVATMSITCFGTALTLFLGLKVERRRLELERIELENAAKFARKEKEAKELERLRERLRAGVIFDPPSADKFISDSGYRFYEDYDYGTPLVYPRISNMLPPPQPSAHFVVDGDHTYSPDGLVEPRWVAEKPTEETMLDFNKAAVAREEKLSEPESDICKHCLRQIKDGKHTEGMNRGKMRCDPEDSQLVYGYNAEPSDEECGPTCMGHVD